MPPVARACALALPIALLLASTAGAQTNAASVTTVEQTITNNSPYELRLGMTVVSETGEMRDPPAARIAPDGSDTARVGTPSPVNGADLITVYNAYKVRPGPDEYRGTILIRSDSNCNTVFFLRPVCVSHSAGNRAFAGGNGALRATWGNNGDTTWFKTTFDVRAGTGRPTRPRPYEDDAVIPEGVTAEELAQQAAQESGAGDDNGHSWDTLPSMINNTPYDLRLITTWNNEQAEYHARPPARIAPGETGFSHIGNDAKFHGVAVVYLWDVLDARSDRWLGTMVTYAATKCGFSIVKVGCLTSSTEFGKMDDPGGRAKLRVVPNAGEAPEYTRPQFFFSTGGGG
jgi:hypothetical protein